MASIEEIEAEHKVWLTSEVALKRIKELECEANSSPDSSQRYQAWKPDRYKSRADDSDTNHD